MFILQTCTLYVGFSKSRTAQRRLALAFCCIGGRVVETMAASSADDNPTQMAALLGMVTVRIKKTDEEPA